MTLTRFHDHRAAVGSVTLDRYHYAGPCSIYFCNRVNCSQGNNPSKNLELHFNCDYSLTVSSYSPSTQLTLIARYCNHENWNQLLLLTGNRKFGSIIRYSHISLLHYYSFVTEMSLWGEFSLFVSREQSFSTLTFIRNVFLFPTENPFM